MQAEEEEEEAIQEKRYNFTFFHDLSPVSCLSLFRAEVERTLAAPRSASPRAKAALVRSGSTSPIFRDKMTINTKNGGEWLPFYTGRRCDGTRTSWKVSLPRPGFFPSRFKRALSKCSKLAFISGLLFIHEVILRLIDFFPQKPLI